MELIVRAVDVGSGNTKFVTAVAGTDIRCVSFPSVAYPCSDASPSWPASERTKTVCIPVGRLFYEVGPDVSLAADTFRAKQLHDGYTESPEYLALLRGALSMMKLSHIDLLVVGLPVALFAVKKAALEKLMAGSHDIGGGKTVTVGKALAVAQPQGALVHYACEHKKMATIGSEQSLIIDPGSRTFDWLVARGMRLVRKQSHSFNRGISDVLRLLASEITKSIGTPYRDYDAIDLALRSGKPPVIYQKAYDISRHLPLARVGRRTGGVDDEGVDRVAAQPAEHHPGGRWGVPVPQGGQGGVPDAPHPRGEGADVRQRPGVPARGAELCAQRDGRRRA